GTAPYCVVAICSLRPRIRRTCRLELAATLRFPCLAETAPDLLRQRAAQLGVRVQPRNSVVMAVVVHGDFVEALVVLVAGVAPRHDRIFPIDDEQLAMVPTPERDQPDTFP